VDTHPSNFLGLEPRYTDYKSARFAVLSVPYEATTTYRGGARHGPKAILDVRATLEVLEARGVPVVALGTDELPGFFSRGSGIPAPQSVPDEAAAAALAAVHLELLGSGVLICVPVPVADELPRAEAVTAIARAAAEAEAAGIHGPAVTPWVLRRVADLTDGRSIRANAALIINDARVAGRLAAALARA